jgi:hypothetical protein
LPEFILNLFDQSLYLRSSLSVFGVQMMATL